jgi:hypothetical protein
VGVGVTDASFAAEVQSELSQVVRIIGFFCTPACAKAEDAKGQEARHLVETLGRAHRGGAEVIAHRRAGMQG